MTTQKLSPGIVRRIVRFSAPYRKMLLVLLALITVDALATTANPLVYRAIIDDGIVPKDRAVIVELAVLLAGLAIVDAALSLWQRWISARVGEGLIFNMRT